MLLGLNRTVEPSVQYLFLRGGERFLICSDGLTEHLSFQEIQDTLRRHPDRNEAAHLLVDTALARGGHDNITILLVDVEK